MSESMLRPIGFLLARHVLRFYLPAVLVVTGLLAIALQRENRLSLQHEVEALAEAVQSIAAQALVDAQPPALQALAKGLLQYDAIGGVRIGDNLDALQVLAARDGSDTLGEVSVHRAIISELDRGEPARVGYLEFALNEDLIRARTWRLMGWCLLGALGHAAILWLLLRWWTQRLVVRPLARLARDEDGSAWGDEVDRPDTNNMNATNQDAFLELRQLRLAFEDVLRTAHRAQRLEAEKLAAERRSAEQSRFLANASHDLRQPLHALSLYLGALGRHEMFAAPAKLVGKAQQCAQVTEDMFRSILDLSRLDAGAIEVRVAAFPLQDILDAVQIQFEPLARDKGIELRVVGTHRWVLSDRTLAGRIVHNLVSNAVRYTTRGRVLVGCRRSGNAIRIEVHDTGPGIADENRRSIFGEYERGPHAGGKQPVTQQGLGLGLAIAQRLSSALGHDLALRSALGHGTSAALKLPLAHPMNAPDGPQLDTDDAGATSTATLAGKLVLIVDDEPAILDATSTLIETWGGIPVTAASYDEAIELMQTPDFVPDVVLCDFELSGEAVGDSLIQRIRRSVGFTVPALLITGARLPELDRPLSAHVLYKPLAEETLRQALIAVLTRH